MKTNYMIALKVPNSWKPPWKMPKTDTRLNSEVPPGNKMPKNFQYKLGVTLKDVQDFIKKYWLHD